MFSPADIGIRRAMEKAYDLPLGLKKRKNFRAMATMAIVLFVGRCGFSYED